MYPFTCNLYGGECIGCGDCFNEESDDDYWVDFKTDELIDETLWRDSNGKNTLEEGRF